MPFLSPEDLPDFAVRRERYAYPYPSLEVWESSFTSAVLAPKELSVVYCFAGYDGEAWTVYVGETGEGFQGRTRNGHRGKKMADESRLNKTFVFARSAGPWNTDDRKAVEKELTTKLSELGLNLANQASKSARGLSISEQELEDSVGIMIGHVLFSLGHESVNASTFMETVEENLDAQIAAPKKDAALIADVSTDRHLSKQEVEIDYMSLVPPFTATDNTGFTLTRDTITSQRGVKGGDRGALQAGWISHLTEDPVKAKELLMLFSGAWRVQPADGFHIATDPDRYFAAANGVFIHAHDPGYPISALKDMKRIGLHFGLELQVTDATGKDLLSLVRIKGVRSATNTGGIVDSLGVECFAGTLKKSYIAYFTALAKEPLILAQLKSLALDEAFTPLGVEEREGKSGVMLTTEIAPGLFLETNLSTQTRLRHLKDWNKSLNRGIKIVEPDNDET